MRIQGLAPGERLQLTNDGALELFWIGTGGAFAELHYHTNFIAVKGDTHLAVDCGLTFKQALRDTAGLVPTDIRNIIATHSHPDHVGSLADFALRHRYPGVRFLAEDRPRLVIPQEYENELWQHCLYGGLHCNERHDKEYLELADFFQIHYAEPIGDEPRRRFAFQIGDLRVELVRTNHIPETAASWREAGYSYGLYFPDDRVFVSVDTKFDPELLALYNERADHIFHDVQFFKGGVHAPLEDLHTLPPELKSRMLLMHYTDNWLEQDIHDFAGWTEQGKRYIFDAQ